MTANELISINSDKVRRDSNLMALYINHFEKAFGHKPNCAGCTFKSDWQRFVAKIKGTDTQSKTTENMNTSIDFKLKRRENKILSYKKNGKTYRQYDTKLTADFVNGYLTNGTPEQLKERKTAFQILPEKFRPKTKTEPVEEPVKEDAVTTDPTEEVKPEAQPKAEAPKKKTRKNKKA